MNYTVEHSEEGPLYSGDSIEEARKVYRNWIDITKGHLEQGVYEQDEGYPNLYILDLRTHDVVNACDLGF